MDSAQGSACGRGGEGREGKGGRERRKHREEIWDDGNVSVMRLYCYPTHTKVQNSMEEENTS